METINEKKTIQDLPEEIIAKILSHLSVSSLKAAALTCKNWNEISSKMGWKLDLNFENERGIEEPWVEVLLESNRNFKSIQLLSYVEMRNVRLMNFFEKHGGNVQKLVMFYGKFHNFQIFCDVLNSMPNLKEVTFRYSNTRGRFVNNFFEDHLPHLQKLESLKVFGSDLQLMKYFEKAQIKSLETFVITLDAKVQEDMTKTLLDFLTNQKNLKCLDLNSISASFFSEFFKKSVATGNIPSKLKELSISCINEAETLNDFNLLKFFEFHSDTVEKLGVGCPLPDFIFEFIFAKLKRPTSLTFFGEGLPNDLPLYERLEINTNIKTLSFSHYALLGVKEDVLKEILKHVPNVEMLRISGSINLHIVSNALTRLTHLELYGYSRTLHMIKSQSLRSIVIDWSIFTHDWEKFASDNPNVHTIEIKNALENFDIVKLLTNMKLQHLELPKIKVDSSVCKTLRENTQDMISLSIHKASFVNCQENLSEVKCLRFHENDEKCC